MARIEDVRPEVQEFMRSCEKLFGFTLTNGRLSVVECEFLHHYSKDLQDQIGLLCSGPEQNSPRPVVLPLIKITSYPSMPALDLRPSQSIATKQSNLDFIILAS